MNALQRIVARGATGQSVIVRCQNQISFVPQTSIAPTQAGLIVKYHRLLDATSPEGGVSVALVSMGASPGLSVGWSAGAVLPIVDGYYRVDMPDAAFANAVGVNAVLVDVQSTAHVWTGCLVQLADTVVTSQTGNTPLRF